MGRPSRAAWRSTPCWRANAAVINLLGGGNIYGNVDIEADDVINVEGGETSFDGIINPECVPVAGLRRRLVSFVRPGRCSTSPRAPCSCAITRPARTMTGRPMCSSTRST